MDTNPILPSSFDRSWCAARLTAATPKSYGYDVCYQEGVMSWGISLDGPTVLPVPRIGDALAVHSTSVIGCVILKDQLVKGCLPAGMTLAEVIIWRDARLAARDAATVPPRIWTDDEQAAYWVARRLQQRNALRAERDLALIRAPHLEARWTVRHAYASISNGVPFKEPPGYREAEPDTRILDVMIDPRDPTPTNAEDRR